MIRLVHLAAKVSRTGGISPLCAASPKRLNLRTASWTVRIAAVTCPACRARASQQEATP